MHPRHRRRNAVLEALLAFRAVDSRANLTDVLLVLYVAENPGINITELAEVTGLNMATASRCIRSLSDEDTAGALPPYSGLVAISPNPNDPRGRILRLSAAGEALCRRIDAAVARGVLIDGSVAHSV
jgi:DNA-binding MarR family transcriptional regulator